MTKILEVISTLNVEFQNAYPSKSLVEVYVELVNKYGNKIRVGENYLTKKIYDKRKLMPDTASSHTEESVDENYENKDS